MSMTKQVTETPVTRPHNGMATYLVVWAGQFVSAFGSGLTTFALGVWVYQQTASVPQFAAIALAAFVPRIVLGPLAGTLVDRWDRRLIMLGSDAVAGLCTLVLMVVLALGRLHLWHIYAGVLIAAIANVCQWPAFAAATAQLVVPEQLGRTNGLGQMSQAVVVVVSPALAAVLMSAIDLEGVMLIDVISFVCALGTLAVVRFPPRSSASALTHTAVLADMANGWRFITSRPGLVKLLIFFTIINCIGGLISVLLTPLILSFAHVLALGTILSIGGLGMLAGGVMLGVWGGPQHPVHGIVGATLLLGVGLIALGTQTTAVPFTIALFCTYCLIALLNGTNQTIWQLATPPDIHGRVLGISATIASSTIPVAYAVAGPLVDRVIAPLLRSGGPLAPWLGFVFGGGADREIGVLFAVAGLIMLLVAALGYTSRDLRTLA